MQAFKNISDQKYSLLNWFEFSLIILSSVLLGIWAAANTIALRNILLVLGALLSIVYFYQLHRQDQLKQYFGVRNSIPLICIIGLFLWVLAHCFLFPTDYVAQIDELKSTWLRSALAAVVGVATGIAINRNPNKIYWLWIGMIFSFVFLFGQYLIDVLQTKNIYPGGYIKYIFSGKVNGVLVGGILIAGVLGSLTCAKNNRSSRRKLLSFLVAAVVLLILFSYQFILETRSGFLVASVLILIWTVSNIGVIIQAINSSTRSKIFAILVMLLLIGLLYSHIKKNQEWFNLHEDIKISRQVDLYDTWQRDENTSVIPRTPDGRYISTNTYLRISWLTVGIELLPENIWGHGILTNSFQGALNNSRFSNARVKSTHSGWLDLYFSLGFMGIMLLIGSLIWFLIYGFSNGGIFSEVVILLSLLLIIQLMISEMSNKHSLEILQYLICLMAGLMLKEINLYYPKIK